MRLTSIVRFVLSRMNASPHPPPCAEWMATPTPAHAQHTQHESLLIMKVAARQWELEMVSFMTAVTLNSSLTMYGPSFAHDLQFKNVYSKKESCYKIQSETSAHIFVASLLSPKDMREVLLFKMLMHLTFSSKLFTNLFSFGSITFVIIQLSEYQHFLQQVNKTPISDL